MGKKRCKSIAIVTGASSGMGREAVLQLGDRFGGLEEIWAVARREDRLKELAKESVIPVRIFPLDLSAREGVKILEDALKAETPAVRFLVNAAGFGKNGPSSQIYWEDEADMVRVNCEALCSVTNMALPYLAKGARVLQFASAAAFLPQPEFAVYAASKAFVLSYSRGLDAELRSRGICVTAVCPGPVKTEFFQVMEEGQPKRDYPLYKRLAMAKPEKVVKWAILDSMAGKRVSVYGPLMKGFYLLCKILPHEFLLYLMRGFSAEGPFTTKRLSAKEAGKGEDKG